MRRTIGEDATLSIALTESVKFLSKQIHVHAHYIHSITNLSYEMFSEMIEAQDRSLTRTSIVSVLAIFDDSPSPDNLPRVLLKIKNYLQYCSITFKYFVNCSTYMIPLYSETRQRMSDVVVSSQRSKKCSKQYLICAQETRTMYRMHLGSTVFSH